MIRFFTSIFALVVIALNFGCGSGNETETAKANAPNAGNKAATRTAAPSNGVQPLSNNASTGNASNASENPLVAARNTKLEARRKAAADTSAPRPDIEAILQRSTRPAPENSEFSVALTNIVVERRRFLNHPVLAAIEKVTDGGKSTIKVVTTDGRTIDLPGSAIEKLSVASSISILRSAGLDGASARPSARKPGAGDGN